MKIHHALPGGHPLLPPPFPLMHPHQPPGPPVPLAGGGYEGERGRRARGQRPIGRTMQTGIKYVGATNPSSATSSDFVATAVRTGGDAPPKPATAVVEISDGETDDGATELAIARQAGATQAGATQVNAGTSSPPPVRNRALEQDGDGVRPKSSGSPIIDWPFSSPAKASSPVKSSRFPRNSVPVSTSVGGGKSPSEKRKRRTSSPSKVIKRKSGQASPTIAVARQAPSPRPGRLIGPDSDGSGKKSSRVTPSTSRRVSQLHARLPFIPRSHPSIHPHARADTKKLPKKSPAKSLAPRQLNLKGLPRQLPVKGSPSKSPKKSPAKRSPSKGSPTKRLRRADQGASSSPSVPGIASLYAGRGGRDAYARAISETPYVMLQPIRFMVSWSGVLVVALGGFPKAVVDLKARLKRAMPFLKDENPGR